jgi:hypothetical protein
MSEIKMEHFDKSSQASGTVEWSDGSIWASGVVGVRELRLMRLTIRSNVAN